MLRILLTLLIMCSATSAYAQCPTEAIVLSTQAEVDNFSVNYPNCTMLTHDFKVDGETSTISNLNGLSAITHAANFYIMKTAITDFSGLENLISTEHMSIGFNQNIENLSGLSALQEVEEINIWFNGALTSLDGAGNLNSMLRLNIFQNYSLEDISELSDLQTLTSLSIAGNGLSNLNGLENLQSIEEDIFISNELISNFNELANLSSFSGSMYLWNNHELVDLSVFGNIESLNDLIVVECSQLSNLNGLESVHTVDGILRIGFNSSLTDLGGLENLNSVGSLDIYENMSLVSLSGLNNLTSVSGNVYLLDNPLMDDISALNNVEVTGVNQLAIARNPNLAVCDNNFVCAVVFDPQIEKQIESNAVGCSSIPQVSASCILGADDIDFDNSVMLSPNPAKSNFFIALPDGIVLHKVQVLSALGQVVFEGSVTNINVDRLLNGLYFVNIYTDRGQTTKKLLKH